MRTFIKSVVCSALLLTAAMAQSAPAKPLKIGDVTISGSFRTRLENWNFFDTPAADGEYNFAGHLLRFSLSQKKEDYDWQIETAIPILVALPGTAIAPAPQGQLGLGASYFAANGNRRNAASIFVKQAFLRFTGSEDRFSAMRFGRFEFIEGLENQQKDSTLAFLKRERIGHRLVGNFGFTHVGRSFDGIEFKRDSGVHNLTVMAGRATRGVLQTDAIGELDVDILYAGYTWNYKVHKLPGEWRVFGLGYHDGRRVLKVDNRAALLRAADASNIRIGTVGVHMLQTAKVGKSKADFLMWAALQFGGWGNLEHQAAAMAFEAGFQPAIFGKPWIRGGYNASSGDGNPNDRTHGTFFEPLGTPRIYARFPFYNHMNLQDAFGQLLLRPHRRLTLRSEYHRLWLSSANDFWYAGGGAFSQKVFGMTGRPSSGSRDLGSVVDGGVDFDITRQLTVSGYYAHAFGGRVIESLFPQRADADYAYFEVIYRF